MKQFFILLCMFLFSTGVAVAQVGLEDIVIETYYVANATDIAYSVPGTVDPLPAGATTYRMYVDMAAGWELQAIFGATNVGTGEVDTLVFRSTQPFWNHLDRGNLYGYGIAANQVDENSVALDSWFSTGRSTLTSAGVLEVLPTEDTNGQTPTHPHTPANMLIHNAAAAGLPLTSEDGNIPSSATITWTPTPGIEAILDPIFGTTNSAATQVVVNDGALGVTVSLQGPTAANRILVGQFTTGGVFSGQINIQIRNISSGVVETYVARTPVSGQFTHPALIWGPNSLPVVNITTPTEGQNFAAGATVNIAATATDTDGSITQVQFYKDGTLIATVPGPGPYTTSFVAGLVTTTHTLVARATDNDGGIVSDTVHINVLGNNPPVVVLTAPATAITGSTVNISATATDPDGITQVEFFFNGSSIGVDASAPYQASFTATPAGVRVIQAKATDGLGAIGTVSQNITISNNVAPTVTINSPVSGAFLPEGPVTITTTGVADADGTVAQVEFFANGVSVGVDLTAPYSAIWNAVFVPPFGAVTLTAVVTDNLGLTGNSNAVAVNVINPLGSPYVVESVSQECNDATVCMPIKAVSAISNVIGFDLIVEWDNTKVYPTGNITKRSDLVNANYFETDNSIDNVNHKMLISVFLDVDAPSGTFFNGTGDIICVEFAKRPGFLPVDTTTIEVTNLQESYVDGVQLQNPVPPGDFTTFRNTLFTSRVEFWEDGSPIYYDGTNLVTNIQANTSIDCSNNSAASPAVLTGPIVTPDVNGFFTYDLNNGVKFSMDKNIAGTTDVQEVINGFDALLTRRVLIDDPAFTPSIYQAIAMDVNRDGVISAGDVSQINQRAVLALDEFKQQWNYNSNGTPKATYSASKDWQFVDNAAIFLNPSYQISSSYPADNGVGYSKARVPKVPFCLVAPVSHFASCPEIGEEIYTGIMYGDINGNYKNTSNLLIRTNESVNVEIGQAQYVDQYVDVPVTFTSTEDIFAIDLNLDFNSNKLTYSEVIAEGMQVVGYFNPADGKLRITSNSLNVLTAGSVSFTIRFTQVVPATLHTVDFGTAVGFLNGDKVNVNLVAGNGSEKEEYFNVYPNPTSGFVYIGIDKDVTADVVDMNGKVWLSGISVSANSTKRVDVSSLPVGLYTIRVINGDFTNAQRVFIGR